MKRTILSAICLMTLGAGALFAPPAAGAPRPLLAFVTWYGGSDLDIRVLYTDGTISDEVTPPGIELPPARLGNAGSWFSLSPDGQRIAFVGWTYGCVWAPVNQCPYWGESVIYTSNIDGTGLTPIYHPDDSLSLVANPEWSPDGKKILFHKYFKRVDGNKRHPDIWVLTETAVGTWEPSPLITRPGGERWSEWSPDGRSIAYEYDPDSNGLVDKTDKQETPGSVIAVSSADGSGPHRTLTDLGRFATDPAFSPDGRSIAYADYPHSWASEDGVIRLVDVDGSNDKKLGGGFKYPWALDFSPDGRFVAFGEGWKWQHSRILQISVRSPHRATQLLDNPEVPDHLPEYFPMP